MKKISVNELSNKLSVLGLSIYDVCRVTDVLHDLGFLEKSVPLTSEMIELNNAAINFHEQSSSPVIFICADYLKEGETFNQLYIRHYGHPDLLKKLFKNFITQYSGRANIFYEAVNEIKKANKLPVQ